MVIYIFYSAYTCVCVCALPFLLFFPGASHQFPCQISFGICRPNIASLGWDSPVVELFFQCVN